MRLVVCCDAFLPADQEGGPPFSTFNLCAALSEAGDDVRVITTDRNGSGQLDVPTDQWTRYDGLPVWYAHSLGRPFYPAASARHALRSTEGIDCLFASGTLWTHLGLLAWRESRRHGIPSIICPRGLLDQWALAHKPTRKRLYWALVARRMVKQAAAVVALSEHERETVRSKAVAQRIEVIPNSIRVEDFDHPPPRVELDQWFPQLRDQRFVLFLGRIHEKKGLPALIGALSRPELIDRQFLIVIAGPIDAGYRARFDQLVQSCPSRTRLVFPGSVSGPQKAALLAHATAFVLPSLSEGQPVAVLEALASACPTILTPGCYMPEVARAGAGIEVESDPAAVAAAIARLLSDDVFRRNMGQRGRELAREQFDWRAVGRRMHALCCDVAATR